MLFIIILVIAIVLILVLYFKYIKRIIFNDVALITGAPKTGKSLYCVKLALKTHRIQTFKYYIGKYLFFKKNLEKPILISNMPLLKLKYTELNLNVLERKVRIPYKSTLLIDECSLVADSMLYKNQDINDKLVLFVKLFAHYTRGGKAFINTQALSDLHYAWKRCIGSFVWITKCYKRIPFVCMLQVKEMLYNDDVGVSNELNKNENTDINKWVIIPKKYYKLYDCYYLSGLTDDLPICETNSIYNKKRNKLKRNYILSFRTWKGVKSEREKV